MSSYFKLYKFLPILETLSLRDFRILEDKKIIIRGRGYNIITLKPDPLISGETDWIMGGEPYPKKGTPFSLFLAPSLNMIWNG